MSTHTQFIVQKLWNYCNILRDDGMSYGDYVEQLTYLLFLKMAYERTQPPYNEPSRIPEGLGWETLRAKDGDELEKHYRHILEQLGSKTGMLGIIFRKAINKIQNPAHLRRLVADLIDDIPWTTMEADVKGDAYEGLLEKNARGYQKRRGPVFHSARVNPGDCGCDAASADAEDMRPRLRNRGIPAGRARLYSDHYEGMTRGERKFLKNQAFQGWEIVNSTARLCVMNMFLHGIGDENAPDPAIHVFDSLRTKPGEYFDMVLTNPPFGRKSSLSLGPSNGNKKNGTNGSNEREAGTISRDDFWATTSNKQLNFVQHVYSLLKTSGRAAVVVPDNVLFEGGAGETIRRNLLQTCDVHTLLRLPTGIFYAQGVKANVLFFDKRPASPKPQTERLWVYDLRTNMNFTLRTNQLKRAHLDDFVACYHPENRRQRQENERFHAFSYEELLKRDKLSLDLFWLRDESLEGTDKLPPPAVIAASIVEDLQNALEQFMAIAEDLGGKTNGNSGPLFL